MRRCSEHSLRPGNWTDVAFGTVMPAMDAGLPHQAQRRATLGAHGNQLKSEKGTLVMTPRTPATVLTSLVLTMG
jgi:hypothetical protein